MQDVLDDLAITDDERILAMDELEATKKEKELTSKVSQPSDILCISPQWAAFTPLCRTVPLYRTERWKRTRGLPRCTTRHARVRWGNIHRIWTTRGATLTQRCGFGNIMFSTRHVKPGETPA
jgi:hypothetical protein